MHDSADRVLAVDAYRGIVMLLLLPDLHGGFSFYRLAERFPDSPVWTALGRLFTHAQWSGCTVWDLIQPSFCLLVGIAMPLSASARRARGDTRFEIAAHVFLRAAALFFLALIFEISFRTLIDELWPVIVLAAGLSIHPAVATALGLRSRAQRRRAELVWSAVVVTTTAVWVYSHLDAVGNYNLTTIFSQLGLAIPFAFLLVGRGTRVQLGVAFAILALSWLAYATYPPAGPGFDAAAVGVAPTDQWYTGFFAHWNKSANFGSAFDLWFLNALPRSEVFQYDANGLATLNFVTTIATIVFGVMCGELLKSGRAPREIRNTLLKAAVAAIALGVATTPLCPLVKSLWTPSWTLFSAGITLLALAGLYHACDIRGHRAWAVPLKVLGTNSILLYVFSESYRWWFLSLPKRVLGIDVGAGPYGPLQESVVFAIMLALIALVLYRLRIFVRL